MKSFRPYLIILAVVIVLGAILAFLLRGSGNQTYRSSAYGFSFKYPGDWHLATSPSVNDKSNFIVSVGKHMPGDLVFYSSGNADDLCKDKVIDDSHKSSLTIGGKLSTAALVYRCGSEGSQKYLIGVKLGSASDAWILLDLYPYCVNGPCLGTDPVKAYAIIDSLTNASFRS